MRSHFNDLVRFWSKVDVRGPDECWPWLGKGPGGYGVMMFAGRMVKATHIAWEIAHEGEPFPEGKEAAHLCHFPPCCNPAHIVAATHAENISHSVRDGRYKANHTRGDTHWTRLRPESALRGEQHGRARLTEADVLEIRRIYAAGEMAQHPLAHRFGVSRSLIKDIVQGKCWRHLL